MKNYINFSCFRSEMNLLPLEKYNMDEMQRVTQKL